MLTLNRYDNLLAIPVSSLTLGQECLIIESGRVYEWVGDAWVLRIFSGKSEYLNPGEPVTIYVREDGYDDSGDGKTEATAYRQIQRALDDIPNQFKRNIYIDVGPGNFESFWCTVSPANSEVMAQILIIGSRANPLFENLPLTVSVVAGTTSQRRIETVGYADTVGTDTHWFYTELDSNFGETHPVAGYQCMPSTTPWVHFVSGFNPGGATRIRGIYPFETIIECQPRNLCGFAFPEVGQCFGLRIENNNTLLSSADIAKLKNINYQGCVLASPSNSFIITNGNGRVGGTAAFNITFETTGDQIKDGIGGYFRNLSLSVSVPLSFMRFRLGLVIENTTVGMRLNGPGARAVVGSVDFIDISQHCFNLFNNNQLTLESGESLTDCNAWLTASNSSVISRTGGNITGTTTGTFMTLASGSKSSNILAGLPADALITLGAIQNVPVSALPINDYGLGSSSQNCEAS